MIPKHIFWLHTKYYLTHQHCPHMPALLSQETQISSPDAAGPLRHTRIQSQIHPYSAQPQSRCLHSRAEMGREWLLQGDQRCLCLHRNQPTSPKDWLSIFIKGGVFLWRKRGIKELFWKRPVQTQTQQQVHVVKVATGQRSPHLLQVTAGQSTELSRLQKVRQKQ